MKKTIGKLTLNRETLRRLQGGELSAIRGANRAADPYASVPSCIDGCPTVFTCSTQLETGG